MPGRVEGPVCQPIIHSRRQIWIGIGPLIVSAVFAVSCFNPKIYDAEMVPMAAVFAGWYGHDPVSGECIGGLGSTHWNDGPNTGGVRYTPENGYYCSGDPEIVSWQLVQMDDSPIHQSGRGSWENSFGYAARLYPR